MKSLFIILLILCINNVSPQETSRINPDILYKTWHAKWVTYPGISGKEYGVYLFRKTIQLKPVAKEFIVHISADNRYKLFVNGKYICTGPSRGDFLKWKFESVDILPYMQKGENIISAVVWNFAEYRPAAQFSNRTGFIMQGDTEIESVINTNSTWKVLKDSSYSPLPVNINQYYVVGPGEKFDEGSHPWNWTEQKFNDSSWKSAVELEPGTPLKSFKEYGNLSKYVLVPREIPFMERKVQRFSQIRRSNANNIPAQFIKGTENLIIPANTSASILFDQKYLTDAYPVLTISGGDKSEITLIYAEALFNDKMEKGNRNDIENKKIIGNKDIIISGGGDSRTYQPLWWRTFRYVEMKVETKNEPLTINDFYSIYTGYPLKEKAYFESNDSILTQIWNAGWHTQRLCTGETFFDCPYYEQLQYAGDTRIQCFTIYYVSGDTLMMRNAIRSFYDSRLLFGLTQSRYPSYDTQIIPTYSLVWITMVYDYWMLCSDHEFIKTIIPGIMDVLNWYKSRVDSSGLLGYMEWWNFVDWVNFKGWHSGIPPGLNSSSSAIINLQYVYTLQKASLLFNAFNLKGQASEYLRQAEKIKLNVYSKCFDEKEGLLADTPEKISFSQHTNILGILTNTFSANSYAKVLNKIINKKDIAQCSYYFMFYLFEALEKAGMSDKFLELLNPWKKMLDSGLTTFAEEPEPSRSDCHAWSASPVYYLLSLVCGIKPIEPGFNSVRIEPHLGNLYRISGSMPHRLGDIKVDLKKNNKGLLNGEVILPEHLKGVFIYNNKKILLTGGKNSIQITNKQ